MSSNLSSPTPRGTALRVEALEPRDVPAASSAPLNLTPVGDRVFFTADDGVHGRELWVSDGTPAGTHLVKDITPGQDSSLPRQMTAFRGLVYFEAGDGVHGRELWRTDGTPEGTQMVVDLAAGAADSTPLDLVAAGDSLFFAADQPGRGRELWKTAGTAAGTVLVKDIAAGSGSSFPQELTVVNGTVFFTAAATVTTGTGRRARTTSLGRELWKSDGTAAGTVMVKEINTSFDQFLDPALLTAVGNKLFFAAGTPATGRELWVSDGTAAGTTLVEDITPGTGSSDLRAFTDLNGTLLVAAKNATDFSAPTALWRSDGTAAGTVVVKDAVAPPSGATLTVAGGSAFFQVVTPTAATELWRTDGTAAGTQFVRTVLADATKVPDDQLFAVSLTSGAVGDTVFFTVFDQVGGVTQPWKLDAVSGSQELVREGINPSDLTGAGGKMFFVANDGVSGSELWVSDGTADGTRLVSDIFPG